MCVCVPCRVAEVSKLADRLAETERGAAEMRRRLKAASRSIDSLRAENVSLTKKVERHRSRREGHLHDRVVD